ILVDVPLEPIGGLFQCYFIAFSIILHSLSNYEKPTMVRRVLILGAAGRDFHNFNTYFRDNKNYEVVAFTAEQIPGIADCLYPKVRGGLKMIDIFKGTCW